MRSPFICLLLFLLLLSCKKEDKLTFQPLHLSMEDCIDCAQVSIDLPEALDNGRIGNAVNRSLREEVIALLTFEDGTEPETLQEAMESFNSGYQELNKRFPGEEATPWEGRIEAEISFEDAHLLSIRLQSYLFTGGAHGYSSITFLNFNKQKGKEMEDWELFKDQGDFQLYAERAFRKQEDIPADQSINSTGFMFERDSFYLPENIGLTEKGLQLHYNQYEVASYADGPIELTLPYKEVQKYLSQKIKS
ncbi:DUF3298 and DUF4163 domain-containing protein [Poritiphilus flavus]|uniref:DUF4163 domain-containing protein n=1 Tax=Poritiphilus flavus TaxID=2697053 RepID=A0A6L9ED58_9FLAO|nr:DUF3298 and DUF4163 domain-containing protein [Poritiphilus flavus]NAS12553.1 DUF4163 domain-containing protein [Poritiphilus flavus]